MDVSFFNYRFTAALSSWERRDWRSNWLRIERKDPLWTPPPSSIFKEALSPGTNPHLARLNPIFLYARAITRSKGNVSQGPQNLNQGPPYANENVEAAVAAVISLDDPRQENGAAYLGLLKCANDQETFERLLDKLIAALPGQNISKWIGPTGLSPHLGSGLLVDGWNEPPPLYAPYNPPYLPEIVSSVMEPIMASRLLTYDLLVPDTQAFGNDSDPDRFKLHPFRLAELSRGLLPLLQAACQNSIGLPLPDELEAEFLIRWLSYWPSYGWVVEHEANPAAFILIQPDYGRVLRNTGGGRGLVGSARLNWARKSARPLQGRLVFGGVLPELRGKGIGTQLWKQAVQFGRTQGWNSLSIGPLEEASEGLTFLLRRGAVQRQTYQFYQYDLS